MECCPHSHHPSKVSGILPSAKEPSDWRPFGKTKIFGNWLRLMPRKFHPEDLEGGGGLRNELQHELFRDGDEMLVGRTSGAIQASVLLTVGLSPAARWVSHGLA